MSSSTIDVKSMTIRTIRTETVIRYERTEYPDKIDKFVAAFLKAKRDDNGIGTTHPVTVELRLAGKNSIRIHGGTQGFQTVVKDGEQYNIRSKELDRYFKKFAKTSAKM